MTTKASKISVVVASRNARGSIQECLEALVAQARDGEVEIVVVDNSTDGTTEIIRTRFPGLNLIVQPASALIPELWGVGIRHSTGEIVAITTAHCVPDKDWLLGLTEAHDHAAVAVVGGAIENDKAAGLVDWAVYFCRYAPYMLPFAQGFATEIAGDNASYKRLYLDRFRQAWQNGFWEPTVHAQLRKAGFQLMLVPSIVIHQKRSFGFSDFMKQRFLHGMKFGQERASRFSVGRRAVYALLSPIIPCLFLSRITAQVVRKRRHVVQLLLSSPILGLFLLAWTVGEATGYLRGPTAKSRQLLSAGVAQKERHPRHTAGS